MAENLDVPNTTVSLVVSADIDADAKTPAIVFLNRKLCGSPIASSPLPAVGSP